MLELVKCGCLCGGVSARYPQYKLQCRPVSHIMTGVFFCQIVDPFHPLPISSPIRFLPLEVVTWNAAIEALEGLGSTKIPQWGLLRSLAKSEFGAFQPWNVTSGSHWRILCSLHCYLFTGETNRTFCWQTGSYAHSDPPGYGPAATDIKETVL